MKALLVFLALLEAALGATAVGFCLTDAPILAKVILGVAILAHSCACWAFIIECWRD